MVYHRMKYRHLGVKSSHRRALLRNLVTSLIEHESITTTYAKAKEAQRFAEKLISLGKRNTEAAKNRAEGILFVCSFPSLSPHCSLPGKKSSTDTQCFQRPHELMPKLFGALRERYATRPGGYTRVLRMEPEKEDQAPSAILELVDGARDMRFMMTAKTLASERADGRRTNARTAINVQKVTQFRPDGQTQLERQVAQIEGRLEKETDKEAVEQRRKKGGLQQRVYQRWDLLFGTRGHKKSSMGSSTKKDRRLLQGMADRAAGK